MHGKVVVLFNPIYYDGFGLRLDVSFSLIHSLIHARSSAFIIILHISACFHILSTIITIVIAISWGAKQAWSNSLHAPHILNTKHSHDHRMKCECSYNFIKHPKPLRCYITVIHRTCVHGCVCMCVCNMTRPQKPIQCLGFDNTMAIASCLVKLVLFLRFGCCY